MNCFCEKHILLNKNISDDKFDVAVLKKIKEKLI
jgi:hypothetical protein